MGSVSRVIVHHLVQTQEHHVSVNSRLGLVVTVCHLLMSAPVVVAVVVVVVVVVAQHYCIALSGCASTCQGLLSQV